MALTFFNIDSIRELADWIVAEVARVLPPAEAEAPSPKVQAKLERLDLDVARRVSALAATLNFYQKARLGTIVQGALIEAGYPVAFAKRYVVDLVSLATMAGRR